MFVKALPQSDGQQPQQHRTSEEALTQEQHRPAQKGQAAQKQQQQRLQLSDRRPARLQHDEPHLTDAGEIAVA